MTDGDCVINPVLWLLMAHPPTWTRSRLLMVLPIILETNTTTDSHPTHRGQEHDFCWPSPPTLEKNTSADGWTRTWLSVALQPSWTRTHVNEWQIKLREVCINWLQQYFTKLVFLLVGILFSRRMTHRCCNQQVCQAVYRLNYLISTGRQANRFGGKVFAFRYSQAYTNCTSIHS